MGKVELIMNENDHLEIWAHQRAQQIVFREGANLTKAAQWLDKKRTADSTILLREAIAASLIEAASMRHSLQTDQDAKLASNQNLRGNLKRTAGQNIK